MTELILTSQTRYTSHHRPTALTRFKLITDPENVGIVRIYIGGFVIKTINTLWERLTPEIDLYLFGPGQLFIVPQYNDVMIKGFDRNGVELSEDDFKVQVFIVDLDRYIDNVDIPYISNWYKSFPRHPEDKYKIFICREDIIIWIKIMGSRPGSTHAVSCRGRQFYQSDENTFYFNLDHFYNIEEETDGWGDYPIYPCPGDYYERLHGYSDIEVSGDDYTHVEFFIPVNNFINYRSGLALPQYGNEK